MEVCDVNRELTEVKYAHHCALDQWSEDLALFVRPGVLEFISQLGFRC